jgi:metallo-beta-lactamase class B
MNWKLIVVLFASASAMAQNGRDPSEARVKAAEAAAGREHKGLFSILCAPPAPPILASTTPTPPPTQQGPPPRETWHAEPVKVFDNLYWVGQTEFSSWAVTTSEGIIIIDAIYDYSVEDEVVNGLKKLGLDPETIKYVIVSHGHVDHAGGAKYLQEHFGARVIMSASDWDLIEHDTGGWSKPKRDMTAIDGQKLALGDSTLTMYLTPGHTLGTISTLIPVRDNGKPHVAAEWGGTLFNWLTNRRAYITVGKPDRFWFDTYVNSARRFHDIVAKAGADVIISNPTAYDESKTKLPLLATRKAGDDNPYVIGREATQRYLTVAEQCAMAGLTRLQ